MILPSLTLKEPERLRAIYWGLVTIGSLKMSSTVKGLPSCSPGCKTLAVRDAALDSSAVRIGSWPMLCVTSLAGKVESPLVLLLTLLTAVAGVTELAAVSLAGKVESPLVLLLTLLTAVAGVTELGAVGDLLSSEQPNSTTASKLAKICLFFIRGHRAFQRS